MPKLLFAAFCNGTNRERSSVADDEETVNLYRSTVETPGAAKSACLIGAPGRALVGSLGTAPGRGWFTQDGRTWTVVGTQLVEVFRVTAFSTVVRGTVLDDHQPVTFASNGDGGSQLALTSGGSLYIFDLVTNVLTGPVALPLTNRVVMVSYLDGYFILCEKDSLRGWFSTLLNGLLWDALDFFQRSTASDRFVGIVAFNNRLWGFGTESSEAFQNTGDLDVPFQPIAGSLFQIGLEGPWSLSLGVNTLRWCGRSSRGGGMVYRLEGYGGVRISTHAIEATLSEAATLADAESLTYDQDGHLFYALTLPSCGPEGRTEVWDETEQQWHTRSFWNQTMGREEAWHARGHAFVGTQHVVGSSLDGAVHVFDLATYTDAGGMFRARRRAPYLGAEADWVTLDEVELGIDAGHGLVSGQGSDPQVNLNISRDHGKTWADAGRGRLGALGETLTRCVWTRLGRVRLDRLVLEVVITDAVVRTLGPGLWIRATPGTT